MSRQRVTGMRIPTSPQTRRTRGGWWFHVVIVVGPWVACVGVIVAGDPFLIVPFVLIGVAYLAADVHS